MVTTVPELLAELTLHSDPRLTWYGQGGERVELSGRVLANWVIKSTNLLTEELGIEAGEVVAITMPVHWRTIVVTLAAWTAGASVVAQPDGMRTDPQRPDLTIASSPSPDGGPTLAIELGPLATRFVGDLFGATDYAAQVLGFGDGLGWVTPPEASQSALGKNEGMGFSDVVSYGKLLETATSIAEAAKLTGRRALMRGEGWASEGPAATLLTALGVLATGGSVVLATPGLDGLHHLATSERCTAVWPAREVPSPGSAIS